MRGGVRDGGPGGGNRGPHSITTRRDPSSPPPPKRMRPFHTHTHITHLAVLGVSPIASNRACASASACSRVSAMARGREKGGGGEGGGRRELKGLSFGGTGRRRTAGCAPPQKRKNGVKGLARLDQFTHRQTTETKTQTLSLSLLFPCRHRHQALRRRGRRLHVRGSPHARAGGAPGVQHDEGGHVGDAVVESLKKMRGGRGR